MARTNIKTKNSFTETTHEGAPAARTTVEQQLRRSVMSCMLFENEFYEDGVEISKRIYDLAQKVSPGTLGLIAIEAREDMKLRHVSLLLLVALCKTGAGNNLTSMTIARVIQRADELSELLALYWKLNGKDAPLSAQLKRGLAMAFTKFDAYQLGKYDRKNEIRLRDVLFLTHPKPKDAEQQALWDSLVNNTLNAPDTWEVALSAGEGKKETFERLLSTGKLGYLALLRNLRNMVEANVDRDLVLAALKARKGAEKVLPFRFTAAARHAKSFEPAIDEALIASLKEMEKLPGKTILLVDVSGSMDVKLSEKSDLTRLDAAATLAAIFPGEDVRVFTFSHEVVEVPRRLGMAGIEAISKSQMHGGTYLGEALRTVYKIKHDRLIVITDEQSHDKTVAPDTKHAYLINVASNKNGVGYGRWNHIDGFSENVLRWIAEVEKAGNE
jgi:60 kDa SS-A/Ro ribonucleoprotein